MGFLTAISTFARAFAAYWELKAKRYRHDVREQARNSVEALEDELQILRNSGGIADSLIADRLRDRIVRERTYLAGIEHLSDTDSEA